MTSIVLASTSPYRRELLQRLRLPFDVQAPRVGEQALGGESPRDTALRLALAKAAAVAAQRPEAIVIGSDQVADVDGEPLSKPGTHAAALAQLARMQGRKVVFHTALAVIGPDGVRQVDDVPTAVRFRVLPLAQLDAYLRLEQPYDCAGAAKIESLGITLVESVRSDDPTALIGLPLIRLTSMLATCGLRLPGT
ncbi:MAG: Maf family nucleotide pyrophosphatase [Burkholderiaceae bacterium]|jgi:septum formation protein|nr:Maf family nucleotide pyrophosphatase [Burkholderiaceae bacterium]